MNLKELLKLGIFLMLVSAIAALALSSIYIWTAPKTALQKQLEINRALKEVMPKADKFEKLGARLYIGKKGQMKAGKVYMVDPVGYGGPIEMLVGIDNSKKVTGVKIVSLVETPGLGLNAADSKFLKQFIGKGRDDKLIAKVDIDAIAGATITTQAVCDGVKKVIKTQYKFKSY